MMKNYYDKILKKWSTKSPNKITMKSILDIVGNDVPVSIDSDGIIEIDKELTQQEKTEIEAL